MEILRNAPEGFQVLSGNDDDTLWMMENGGAGIISVASNIAPKQLTDFVDAIRGGYREKAYKYNADLTPLFNNGIVESNPMNYRKRGFVTSALFGITAHESVGLPAPECLMVQELVPGGLEGIHGQVCYSDYECLR